MEPRYRPIVVLGAFFAFILVFAYLPFDANFSADAVRTQTTWDRLSTIAFMFLLPLFSATAARLMHKWGAFMLATIFTFVMWPSAFICDPPGCSDYIVLDAPVVPICAVAWVLSPAIIAGSLRTRDSETGEYERDAGARSRLEPVRIWAAFTAMIGITVAVLDMNLAVDNWSETIAYDLNMEPTLELIYCGYLAAIGALLAPRGMGRSAIWALPITVPVVLAIGVDHTADSRLIAVAAAWSVFVVLPCAAGGVLIEKALHRRAARMQLASSTG